MVGKESDIRMIGYGAMLMEGLVAVVALIAAATLPQGDYWAINIDFANRKYADTLAKMVLASPRRVLEGKLAARHCVVAPAVP